MARWAAAVRCRGAQSAAAKIELYDAKSCAQNSLRMLNAKSTHSNPYVAKALKACHPSISPTIPALVVVARDDSQGAVRDDPRVCVSPSHVLPESNECVQNDRCMDRWHYVPCK